MKLQRRFVEKPWGRVDLPPVFGAPDQRIGEVWFEGEGETAPLLAKFLFTSERLSIQVHPDDAQAAERGWPHGKDECWYVVAAEAEAQLGLGTRRPLGSDELREAAQSGAIETLLDWKPVHAGDFFYIPAGTVHAIGGGLTLIEIQQNVDLTYRLFDYGRPRELHLEDGVEVSVARPYDMTLHRHVDCGWTGRLIDARHFSVDLCCRADDVREGDGPMLIVPVSGSVMIDKLTAGVGDCLTVNSLTGAVASTDSRFLVARPRA